VAKLYQIFELANIFITFLCKKVIIHCEIPQICDYLFHSVEATVVGLANDSFLSVSSTIHDATAVICVECAFQQNK
jgi:hypothetical protein